MLGNRIFNDYDCVFYDFKLLTMDDDIIDFVIPKEQQRTRDNVRKMIPVLIHWAKTRRRDRVYGDLINAIGKKNSLE